MVLLLYIVCTSSCISAQSYNIFSQDMPNSYEIARVGHIPPPRHHSMFTLSEPYEWFPDT